MKKYSEIKQLLTSTTSKEVVDTVTREVCVEFGLENYLYSGLIAITGGASYIFGSLAKYVQA